MNIKRLIKLSAMWPLLWLGAAQADDTDIYINASSSGGAPYLMFMLDYRSDLSGPYCKSSGQDTCKSKLNTPDSLLLLQSLDVLVNGVPGDLNGDGDVDDVLLGENALSAAADGDADFDGLRDSAAVMANFSASKIQALTAVVRVVFEKFSGINVGLAMPNNDGGGFILRGYKEFQDGDTNGAKQELIEILENLPMPGTGNAFHASQPKEMYYEWWRYINGGEVAFGDTAGTANNFSGTATPGRDTSIVTDTIPGNGAEDLVYNSPFESLDPEEYECVDLYSVYVTSGNENQDSDLDAEIEADMSSDATADFASMMEWMSNNDILTEISGDLGEQLLKTWIVRVGESDAKADDWAQAAGTFDDGQYMTVSSKSDGGDLVDVQKTLEAAFIEALSVSTTFVAASVPVNVFNRVQTQDNFFIALFEAKATARWPGNIKKLKLVDTDGDGTFDDIGDALAESAFNDSDGRIKYEALTFWTDADTLPEADPDKNEVSGRDGRAVARGGAGQQIPGMVSGTVGDQNGVGTRQLFYEPVTPGMALPFNSDDATATALMTDLSVGTIADARRLIRWARGQDTEDEDGDGNVTEARDWIMGDAIHSRPLAINYGATSGYSEDNPNIRLFMGTNDGILHQFQNTDTAGNESGTELWGFMPRGTMSILPTLRDNLPGGHPYGVDGEPVALVNDVDADGTIDVGDGDEVFLYFGLRRGGKSYYALDVSNPDSNPVYSGKIDSTMPSYGELGLSFSKPRIAKVRYGAEPLDVVIIAGGYDTNKDGADPQQDGNRGADSEGNAIYIINARTGALVWKVTLGGTTGAQSNTEYHNEDMIHSIPSEVAIFDANRNGIVDRLYVGDTGGYVWRVDLPEGNGSNANHREERWSASVFAVLSDMSSESTDRRFFHAPDLVQTKDDTGLYDGVIIGSGDRANPLENDDQNALFVLKDRNTTSGSPGSAPLTESDLADVTSCTDSCPGELDYSNGWVNYLTSNGEKGLSSPLLVSGSVLFTTYVPNISGASACAPAEGGGQAYVIDLADGEATFENSKMIDVGPGIPASPIALSGNLILLPGTGLDTGGEDMLTSSGPLSCNDKLCNANSQTVWRLYWRSAGKDKL